MRKPGTAVPSKIKRTQRVPKGRHFFRWPSANRDKCTFENSARPEAVSIHIRKIERLP